MKLSAIQLVAALFVAGVRSQSTDCTSVALTSIPACAQSCFVEGAPTIGCGGLDFACQCRQEAALYAAIENCVASSCPSSEFEKVIDGATTVCECANGGSAGSQGSQIVSGSFVSSPSAPPPSVSAPSATPPPTTTTSVSTPGNAGGSGGYPTQSAPSYSATVIIGAGQQLRAVHGPAVYVLAAALVFAVL